MSESAYGYGGEHSDHSAGGNHVDPTQTTHLRKRYAQKLRGTFSAINTEIRAGVGDRDELNLRTEALAADDVEPIPSYEFSVDSRKRAAFEDWLNSQLENGPLEVIEYDGNPYIRSAYRSGIKRAQAEMSKRGATAHVSTYGADIDPFNMGVHQRTLQRLYSRNYETLQGITSDVADEISEELSAGFAEGVGPRKMASRLADRVDSVGKYRSTVLARTEVVNAYNEAALTEYERFGVRNIKVQVEWSTAGDKRVCPICSSLDGNIYTTKQARNETFSYDGDSYPIKPPAHPQCRCALLPVLG